LPSPLFNDEVHGLQGSGVFKGFSDAFEAILDVLAGEASPFDDSLSDQVNEGEYLYASLLWIISKKHLDFVGFAFDIFVDHFLPPAFQADLGT